MNKKEFIERIAEKSELSKVDAEGAYKAMVETITEELRKGEKISLLGFGNFEVRERKARDGVNPSTGEKIKIAASKSPAFKAGKAFKEAIK